MLNDFRLYFFNDDFWVSLDITINASKDPELKGGIREIVPRYRLGMYRRWVGILSEQGWSTADAEEIVRMSAGLTTGDRKSVVSGKGGSLRVEFGGRRMRKTKKRAENAWH